MPRGGPGPGGADIISHGHNFTGTPSDRLISGFLTVNVRNLEQTDANLAYYQGWTANPNSIPENETVTGNPPEGTYPYYSDEGNYDTVDTNKPGYPTDDIFIHGEGGAVGKDGTRIYGRGSTGRTFEVVDPDTMRTQSTLLTLSAAGDSATNISHRSYFTVPAEPGLIDGAGVDKGNGKTCVYFWDTEVGSGSAPVAVNNTGGYNYAIQIPFSSDTDNMGAVSAKIVSVLNSFENDADIQMFKNCAVDGSNRVAINDAIMMRRSDSSSYTSINNLLASGSNGTTPITDPDTAYSFGIEIVVKGSLVGFNRGEQHTHHITGDNLQYEASSKKKPYKKLGIGDYDCFVFFVSMAAHIDGVDYTRNNAVDDYTAWAIKNIGSHYTNGAIPWTEGGQLLYFHHNACQSFIKSSLISRHNNCSNGDAFRTTDTHNFLDAPTSFWTVGSQRTAYTFDNTLGAGERRLNVSGAEHLAKDTDYLQNNGIYRHGRWIDGIYGDGSTTDDYRFGIDLSYGHTDDAHIDDLTNCRGTNNFFSPVHSIDIGINHHLSNQTGNGNTTGGVHDDAFGLAVQVHLYAVNPDDSAVPDAATTHTFFNAQTNVMWQPFGETAEFKILD